MGIRYPTRSSFENHRVAGNLKYRVLPDILGKPGVLDITQYFAHSQTQSGISGITPGQFWVAVSSYLIIPSIFYRKIPLCLAHYLQKKI